MTLSLSGNGITSANITDGTIVNADINASAAIDSSKLSGTGKVLQVVQSEITDDIALSNVGTTWTDVGQSQTITMLGAGSKVIVNVQGAVAQDTNDTDGGIDVCYKVGSGSYTCLGNRTDSAAKGLFGIYHLSGGGNGDWMHHCSINYLHTPSSYSVGDVLTYKLQYVANKANVYWGGFNNSRETTNYIQLIEVAA